MTRNELPQTSFLVAEPLPLFSDALATTLALEGDFSVFEERPSSGQDVVDAAVRLAPNFVLSDYWLPGMEASDLVQGILSKSPETKVVFLSWISAPQHVRSAIESGAAGFLSKDLSSAQLIKVLREISKGGGMQYAEQMQQMIEVRGETSAGHRRLFDTLTARQVEILGLLDSGLNTGKVAERLSISVKTVRNHISDILVKTETSAVGEALAKARLCRFTANSGAPDRPL